MRIIYSKNNPTTNIIDDTILINKLECILLLLHI